MKHWLKNLALAGATASAVVLGAASASAVSFTVVIEKIELMADGSATDRFVIYNPATGVGASATTTLDLLNANKTGSTLPVVAPKSGTYKTMLVTFSNISVAAETATVSATQRLEASLLPAQGFGTELGNEVLVMGEVDNNAGKIGALLGGGITAVPMQPIVSNGATVSLPAFDFFLPASKVVTSGTGSVGVTSLPTPISVARTDVDVASVPNVTIGVKGKAFDGTTAIAAGTGNFAAKVGLFRSALDLKPVYVATATIVSNTLTTDASITEVTFLDVADGTYLPLAWIDSDADGLLDAGEATLMVDGDDTGLVTTNNNLAIGDDNEHFLTVNKSEIYGASATTTGVISTTSAAFNTSATVNDGAPLGSVFGGATANGYLGQSGNFKLFPSREISVTIAFTEDGSTTLDNGTDTCAAAARCGLGITWSGGTHASNTRQASMSFVIGAVTTPSITMELDNGGADGNLDDAETASLVIVDTAGAVPATSNSALLTYTQTDGNSSVLKISPVPLTGITNLDINAASGAASYGTFTISTAIQAQDNAGVADGAIDTASVITETDIVLDGDAAGRFNGTTLTGEIVNANRVGDISANLGN